MIHAARPGGWVLIGDIDFSTVRTARPAPVMDRMLVAFDTAVRAAGWDPALGHSSRDARSRGLSGVEAENSQAHQRGGGPVPSILTMTYRRLRPLLLAGGMIVNRHRAGGPLARRSG